MLLLVLLVVVLLLELLLLLLQMRLPQHPSTVQRIVAVYHVIGGST